MGRPRKEELREVKEEETEVFPKLKAKLDRDELAQLGDKVAAAKARS